MVKLHLGCNTTKIPGFINVDIVATDIICDLLDIRKHWAIASVDYIYTCHTLEYLSRHKYFQTLSDLWTWNFKSWSENLSKMGFTNIKKYDPRTTEHAGIRNWSFDYVPRHDEFGKELPDEIWHQGTLVSLNVEAIKPEEKND